MLSDETGFAGKFGTVAIIGVGLIGGSLGMALKTRRLASHIVGVGRDPARLQKAIAFGAIDTATTDLREGVAEADLIVLCTTVGHIQGILAEVLGWAKDGAVVTDVGSTKSAIVTAAGDASSFVGGHPMAGSEQGGVEAANPTLFEEATWAITPAAGTEARAMELVTRMAQEVGARTLFLTPEAHDSMLAVTSHLPHILAAALMRQASEKQRDYPETSQLTAGSFADATRVAASSPELWRDVCLSNRDAILHALREFRGELSRLENAIITEDPQRIEEFFGGAASAKRGWGTL